MNIFILFFIFAIGVTIFIKFNYEERHPIGKPISLNENDRRFIELCQYAGVPKEDWILGDEVSIPMHSGDMAIYSLSEISSEGKPPVIWYTFKFIRYAIVGDVYYPEIKNKAWWTNDKDKKMPVRLP